MGQREPAGLDVEHDPRHERGHHHDRGAVPDARLDLAAEEVAVGRRPAERLPEGGQLPPGRRRLHPGGEPPAERPLAVREADRRAAIFRAIREAGPVDCVLIAGKGHENYQEAGGIRAPFSDAAVACEALAARRRTP